VAAKKKSTDGNPTLATNRKASHEYHLQDRQEAGIVLTGTEVKSAREGKVNLKEAYCRVRGGELFLLGAHISPYEQGNRENHDPLRPRKLLMHRREIAKLLKETTIGGLTLIATRMYLKRGRIKLEIALAKGKKLHDKRESARTREMDKEAARAKGSRQLD
jgi:SsrA-binding protein